MRGVLPDLPSPHPLGRSLPAIYQEDDFSMRYLSAFDTVLAPIPLTVDCLDAYLDPDLAPEDVLQWLGTWVGVLLDEDWPVARRRALVHEIVDLYARRGTPFGIKRMVELYTGGSVEIIEGGGSAHSLTPGAALPGSPADAFIVRVTPAAGGGGEPLDAARIRLLVAAARPAHLPAVVEIGGAG